MPEADGVDLGIELRTAAVPGSGSVHVGGAVDHRHADAGDDEDGRQQQPVDVEEQSSFEHPELLPRN